MLKVKLQRSIKAAFFRKEREKAVRKEKIEIRISDGDKDAIEKLNAEYKDRMYPQLLEEDPQSLEEITKYINHVALLEE